MDTANTETLPGAVPPLGDLGLQDGGTDRNVMVLKGESETQYIVYTYIYIYSNSVSRAGVGWRHTGQGFKQTGMH